VKERSFVVVISERAREHSIQNIGKALLALADKGIHSGGRSMDAVLHDVLQGIRDNVLLKTELEPDDLDMLLSRHLGRDFKLCTIQWMTNRV
jgi:hypothetical protein